MFLLLHVPSFYYKLICVRVCVTTWTFSEVRTSFVCFHAVSD
jgi:hypothetical protein